MPDLSPWGVTLRTAYCDVCDWHLLLPVEMPLPECPNCHRVTLTPFGDEEPNKADHFTPELYLPFTAGPDLLEKRVQDFAGNIWFAPPDLKAENLKSRLQQLYLPVWLVDTGVNAIWQAETGFNYDAITHRDKYSESQAGWVSEQLTETRVKWEPRLGQLQREYHNISAPALEAHQRLMRKLGDYALRDGRPYHTGVAKRAMIRLPDRAPTDAWPDAIPRLQTNVAEECRQASRADHIRDFKWDSRYHNQNWTLLLLPAYVTYYLDDTQQAQPVLMHGQTGHIAAPRRASMKQARRMAIIIVGVAMAIFTLSLVLGLISFFIPPLFLVAGIGIVIAVMVGMLAIAPVVVVWQFNRSQSTTYGAEEMGG
jgi:hypothetical protein